MDDAAKIINPVLFFIILICFFLPFFNLTCQQQKIASFTGIELISGTTINTDGLNKSLNDFSMQGFKRGTKTENVPPEPLAFIAFFLALGGFIISFFWKYTSIGSGIAGLLGTIVLVFLSSVVTDDVLGKVHYQQLNIECASGYYVALTFFIMAVVYNAYLLFFRSNYVHYDSPKLQDRMIICPSCGTVNDKVSLYCNTCGGNMGHF